MKKKLLIILISFWFCCGAAWSQKFESTNEDFYQKFINEKEIKNLYALTLNDAVPNDSIVNLCLLHIEKLKTNTNLSVCNQLYLDYTKARLLQSQNKFDKSLKILKSTLKEMQDNACDDVALQYLHQDIGSNYNYTGKNTLALENYYTALNYATKAKDTVSMCAIDINIGNIFFTLKNIEKTIKYYENCITISKTNKKFKYLEAKGYAALGSLYLNKEGALPLAKENLSKAVTIYRSLQQDQSMYLAINNLAIVYELEGNNAQAMVLYQQVYDYATKNKDLLQLAYVCFDIALNYKALNDSEKALFYFEESYNNYKKIGMIDGMMDVNSELSFLYEKEKDYKRALNHLDLFVRYKDSLDKSSNAERLMELKKDYEFGIEREQLKTEMVQYQLRNTILGVSLVFILLIGGLIFSFIKRKAAAREVQNQEQFTFQLLQNTEEERSRIAGELHDSVNHDLLNIKNNLVQGNEIQVNDVVKIMEEVRDISRNLHPAVLERAGLEMSIENLCERISEIGLFTTCEINYTNKLSKNKELQLYRIIQEALNNTLKHGKANAAKVILTSIDSYLQLEIKDNGNGFDVDQQLKNPKSFGLQSIFQRAKAIAGKINILSNDKGTQIFIQIPV